MKESRNREEAVKTRHRLQVFHLMYWPPVANPFHSPRDLKDAPL